MKQYVDLVRRILEEGAEKDQRAQLASGDRPKMLSVFGHHARYDLREGFPLVTVKSTPFRVITEELLWMLSGSTNVRPLQDRNVKIWNEWADPETGELGPIYGKQWRHWQTPDGGEVDQIANLVENIRALVKNPQAPCGRRLVVSAWNPGDMEFPGPKPAPMACHTMFQCNVTNGRLSTHLYQRSADVLLGVPFNIAGYSLLTHMLAQVTGLEVGEFIHTMGDAHLYGNHLDQAREVVERQPRALPTLVLDKEVQELDRFRMEHIQLQNYDPHPAVRGEVAV